VDALLLRLLRGATRRALAGDWTWVVIAGSVFMLRRAMRPRDELVHSLKIAPGEQILISVRDADDPPFSSEVSEV
jgi:hypothetical protein